MKIVKRTTLQQFWSEHRNADSEGPLLAWFDETRRAKWKNPAEVKAQFGSASILKGSRIVFNIGGNKYRLVVEVNFYTETVYIRFIGNHKEYDSIDAETVR